MPTRRSSDSIRRRASREAMVDTASEAVDTPAAMRMPMYPSVAN